MYTTVSGREGVPDTPTDDRSKLLLVIRSSSGPRGILNGPVLDRFAGDYD